MGLFDLEHGKLAYRADFALYACASPVLTAWLAMVGPPGQRLGLLALYLAGLAGWTVIEYTLHRYVLHGLRPFSTWHAEHHHRPRALICTPTLPSASLIALLVFLPALAFGGVWRGCALSCGVLSGYLAYTVTHHAVHHWRADGAWLRRRKRWHALHHTARATEAHFGVTTAFWDQAFGAFAAARHRGARAVLLQMRPSRTSTSTITSTSPIPPLGP